MYKIDIHSNSIAPLQRRSFSDLGFRERENLQEWIVKQPNSLGEDLLIIQKEFSGFDGTQERLDLLALDKSGSLVIIENKLDDSGKDVTWQALKYASYCSQLSNSNILKIYQDYLDRYMPASEADAEKMITNFLDCDLSDKDLNKSATQRIMLVAANFRQEVTSTVLWLMNFSVQISCFKAVPYSMGEELILNIEKIIPTKDAEDYMIGMAEKVRDNLVSTKERSDRFSIRKNFWSQLLPAINQSSCQLFRNITPKEYSWIGAASGISGIGFNFCATKSYCRAEIYIDKGDLDENRTIYNTLLRQKSEIENELNGLSLIWEPLDGKRAYRIKAQFEGNLYEREEWDQMIDTMVEAMKKVNSVFMPYLKRL